MVENSIPFPAGTDGSTHTPSQRYLSTSGGEYGVSFEEVLFKGVASDGGLFIPEEIPRLPEGWETTWADLDFPGLAYEILSLYVSTSEISSADLKVIIEGSFLIPNMPRTTPLVTLDAKENLYLPKLSFLALDVKEFALQLLGDLFDYFFARRNKGKKGQEKYHLTLIEATSGDTESATVYGLRGKKDISVFILYPRDCSPEQETQMTTVFEQNVLNLAVEGTFDDCQDAVKALFADPEINSTLNLGIVNTINWVRILVQTTNYFNTYLTLLKDPSFKPSHKVRFALPTGSFGNAFAGYIAQHMGLPVSKLVFATNENDILDRFWKTGRYETQTVAGVDARGEINTESSKEHEDGVKDTLSPVKDIFVPSNFERLLWFLAYEFAAGAHMDDEWTKKQAGQEVEGWLKELKSKGGFGVYSEILDGARRYFESERVSDEQTTAAVKAFDRTGWSRNIFVSRCPTGVAAALQSIKRAPPPVTHHIVLATPQLSNIARDGELAVKDKKDFIFDSPLAEELLKQQEMERRVRVVPKGAGWEDIRSIITEEVRHKLQGLQ